METNELPQLSAEEIRVIGSLIEKSRATPDYYPMTINGLKNACNQKSARNPVVDYDEDKVIEIIGQLRTKGLVGTATGGGSRTTKYKHNLAVHYSLDPADLSILCLLMLRGPLTAGEINSNAGRLYDFDNLDEVNEKLEELSNNTPAFVRKLPRKPGQKEGRFTQLFSAYQEEESTAATEDEQRKDSLDHGSLVETIAKLQEQIKQLQDDVDLLKDLLNS